MTRATCEVCGTHGPTRRIEGATVCLDATACLQRTLAAARALVDGEATK